MDKKAPTYFDDLVWAPDALMGVRGLVSKFGDAAVKNAVKQITSPRKGRKPELDADDLEAVHKRDANLLTQGKKPFTLTSNRSIAKDISKRRPGQSEQSTQRRIMGKLQSDRRPRAYFLAAIMSKDGGHARYLQMLKKAVRTQTGAGQKIIKMWLAECDGHVKRYTELFGKRPDSAFSQKQIVELNNDAEKKSAARTVNVRGLLG